VKHNKDNDYLKALGANLRLLRKSKSITMEELANEAEIEYRQLGRIERGEINTSVLSLLKLSDCLGVDIADLFKF
jgi:transcriptional regulator with XRE-family HTH domain